MLKGEKTTIFWIGLIVLGYSIYQFCTGAFYVLSVFFYSQIGMDSTYLISLIPYVIGGVIFLIIGLYVMKAGVKPSNPQTQE